MTKMQQEIDCVLQQLHNNIEHIQFKMRDFDFKEAAVWVDKTVEAIEEYQAREWHEQTTNI